VQGDSGGGPRSDLELLSFRPVVAFSQHPHPLFLATTTCGVLTLTLLTPTPVIDDGVAVSIMHGALASIAALVDGAVVPATTDTSVPVVVV
jgi:hypothetical protein